MNSPEENNDLTEAMNAFMEIDGGSRVKNLLDCNRSFFSTIAKKMQVDDFERDNGYQFRRVNVGELLHKWLCQYTTSRDGAEEWRKYCHFLANNAQDESVFALTSDSKALIPFIGVYLAIHDIYPAQTLVNANVDSMFSGNGSFGGWLAHNFGLLPPEERLSEWADQGMDQDLARGIFDCFFTPPFVPGLPCQGELARKRAEAALHSKILLAATMRGRKKNTYQENEPVNVATDLLLKKISGRVPMDKFYDPRTPEAWLLELEVSPKVRFCQLLAIAGLRPMNGNDHPDPSVVSRCNVRALKAFPEPLDMKWLRGNGTIGEMPFDDILQYDEDPKARIHEALAGRFNRAAYIRNIRAFEQLLSRPDILGQHVRPLCKTQIELSVESVTWGDLLGTYMVSGVEKGLGTRLMQAVLKHPESWGVPVRMTRKNPKNTRFVTALGGLSTKETPLAFLLLNIPPDDDCNMVVHYLEEIANSDLGAEMWRYINSRKNTSDALEDAGLTWGKMEELKNRVLARQGMVPGTAPDTEHWL